MGQGVSHPSLQEMVRLSKEHELSLAQVEFCFVQYSQPADVRQYPDKKWLIGRAMQILYPDGEPTNFETFLSRLIQWRRASFEDRTKQLFDMLDYDGDGTLTPSDLSILMQNANQTKFQLGDRVRVRYSPKKGVLRHYGPVHMGNGTWAGIELDEPLGLNNGTVDGTTYFKTTDKHGSFVEARHIELELHYNIGLEMTKGEMDCVSFTKQMEPYRDQIMADPLPEIE